ncbi:MAG: hypothetical protein Udaeo2_27770 [Candidatus Udaeobacter sp.]|nr:MAG: hypothetical protein Udaeo2_27770 [Candidatus Udaeobacter sp.]
MGFTCIWTKAKCLLDGRFSQCQPCRRMVEAEKIELLMCVCELAVCLKKRGVARDGLIQQVDRLQQVCFQAAAKTEREQILGAIVEVESKEVGCRRLLNGQFLRSRNFRAKPLSDISRKLALDRKQVIQIAVISLRPDEHTSTSVYQSSLDVKTGASPTVGHSTLENVRNPKGFANFTNVPLSAILHHAGVADHPEIANAGELG